MILTTEDIFFEHDCNATLYTFRLENFSDYTNKKSLCPLCLGGEYKAARPP